MVRYAVYSIDSFNQIWLQNGTKLYLFPKETLQQLLSQNCQEEWQMSIMLKSVVFKTAMAAVALLLFFFVCRIPCRFYCFTGINLSTKTKWLYLVWVGFCLASNFSSTIIKNKHVWQHMKCLIPIWPLFFPQLYITVIGKGLSCVVFVFFPHPGWLEMLRGKYY